jgi:RHS repeat-associated protein
VRSLLLFTACLLLGAVNTPAQNIQHTKNTPGIGMRSVFKVNPATNALELQVSLGPTSYPQRGGASAAPAISYSSRIWRVAYIGATYGTSQGGPPPLTATLLNPRLSENSRMGWTYSLEAPYVDLSGNSSGDEVYDAQGNSTSCSIGSGSSCCFIDRLRIHMPGGGTQEFRSSDHPYCYTTSGAPPLPPDLYSTDGSRMRFNRTENKLYLPDGSYWVLASGSTPAQLFDRNGNRLLNGFTDGLGRTFSNPLNTALGTDYAYTVPGVGGGTLGYTFRWRNLDQVLTVPQPLPNYTDMCGVTLCPEPYLFRSDTGASPPVRMEGGSNKINPLVLHQIVLPTGQTYTFTYNVYGEIDKVVYPTGGYERYVYGVVEQQLSGTYAYNEGNRGVLDRFVSAKGDGSDEVRWQYAWTDAQGQPRRGEITPAPESTRTERLNYNTSYGITFWGYTDARAGRPAEERVYNSANQLIRRTLSEWVNTGSDNCFTGAYSSCTATRNPRLTKTVELIIEPGGQALAKITTYGYDLTQQFTTGVNQTSVSEYGYVAVDQATAQSGSVGSFVPQGQPLRTTETAYLDTTNNAYRSRHILGLPTSVEVKDGAVTLAAKSTMAYDESPYQLVNNYGPVANWADPGALRGNATTVSRWLNTTGGYVQTHAQYDQLGNVVNAWDANGNQTQTAYSPTFGYAYPTSVTTAAPNPTSVPNPDGGAAYGAGTFGLTAGLISTANYDPYTGLITSEVDVNGKTTSYDFTDPLNRLKQVTSPDGGTTSYAYDRYNNAGRVSDYIRTMSALDSSRFITSYQFFDGLGRPTRSFLYEGGSPELYLTTDTQYDAVGRVWRVSNPHRTTGSDQAVNPPGLWTTSEYDALGRVKKVTTADGAEATTAYNGNEMTMTDQAGRKRSNVSDALGRLTQVTEDPTSGGLNYLTTYTYDVLGNLRTVTQGAQSQRVFTYDSLSRLASATNPESGTLTYGYDANGNLTSRTDARGVQTTYKYDGLNRNIIAHYAGGGTATPGVRRYYDNTAAGANGLGRLWWAEKVGVSANAFDGYDVMGRPKQYHQIYWTGNPSWGTSFNVSRVYDKAGNVTSQTYPSGHTVTYNYDAAGRVGDSGTQPSQRAFYGRLGDGVERAYADQVQYSAFGGVEQERFGTQTSLYHKVHYNRRGQLFDVRLSTASWAADQWDWNRGALVNYFGGNYAWEGNPNTPASADNNGNLRRSEVYVPLNPAGSYNASAIGAYYTAQQTYSYDSVNRLQSVAEAHYDSQAGTQAATFTQTNRYDRWGNRTVDLGQSPNMPTAQYDFERGDLANTNRLYAPGDLAYPNPGDPNRRMRYDAAGNLVHDAYTGAGGRTYDAENRMTAAVDGSGGWAYYTYDADGQRVKHKVGSQEWWQVYGPGGELLAEYAASAAPASPQKEYGYRNGQLLVVAAAGTAPSSTQNVAWTSAVGVSVNGNSLQRVSGGFFGGAASSQSIASGDGYVEFTATETNKNRWCGLSNGNSNVFSADIDFAVYLVSGGEVQILEGGAYKGSFNYAAGDRFSVGVTGGVVTYSKNGTVFYTSATAPTYPLLVDTTLYETGGTITNAVISGNLGGGSGGAAEFKWLVADHLDTPRMTVDQTGSLAGVSRHDYLPFGEELTAGAGGRTTAQGYAGDNIRQKFTGHERDGETGLDYAQARYYGSALGRFTGVDPYNPIVDSEREENFRGYLGQPQNWNRYTYVWNNPLKYTDPFGEKVYVVTYTYGNTHGDDELKRAAETKAGHIRDMKGFDPKKDTVLLKGVKTKEDFGGVLKEANGLEKQFGKVEQVTLYSHAGADLGPTFHDGIDNGPTQFSQAELSNLKVNWSSSAIAKFYGCYTGMNFAQNFANAQGVPTYGYDRFAYFSSSVDKRTGPNSTGRHYLIATDGKANGTWLKYMMGNSEAYPMVRREPPRRDKPRR